MHYKYQLTLRPASTENVPRGENMSLHNDNISSYSHGQVWYTKPLPVEQIRNFSLIPLTELDKLDGFTFDRYTDPESGMRVMGKVQWNPDRAYLSLVEYDAADPDTRHEQALTYAQLYEYLPPPPSHEIDKWAVGDYVSYEGSNETKHVRILQVNPADFIDPGYVTYKGLDQEAGSLRLFSETQRIRADQVDERQRESDDKSLQRWSIYYQQKGLPNPYADESDPNIAAQMEARRIVDKSSKGSKKKAPVTASPAGPSARTQALAKAAVEQKILAYQLKFL